jgi:AraC family transcriptional activator of pobA
MDSKAKKLDKAAEESKEPQRMSMVESVVPTFYLYGEPRRAVEERFVHVEALVDRTRPSEWTIRPHTHAELNHIFHVSTGGGAVVTDAGLLPFVAPCLLLIPAGAVHGFRWDYESAGSVVTLATSYLEDFSRRDTGMDALFDTIAVVGCDVAADDGVERTLRNLRQELGWAAPGHRAAADAGLLALLVMALRLRGPQREGPSMPPSPQAALVARLRHLIDERFRLREPVGSFAAALGVSPRRLRDACARIAKMSPGAMLDQRAMLEAQRSLLYGNLSIGEIGYALGFSDPAYFTRFFTRHAGRSPAAFRRLSAQNGA